MNNMTMHINVLFWLLTPKSSAATSRRKSCRATIPTGTPSRTTGM